MKGGNSLGFLGACIAQTTQPRDLVVSAVYTLLTCTLFQLAVVHLTMVHLTNERGASGGRLSHVLLWWVPMY